MAESERIKPRVVSTQIIRNVDDHQAQLINRMRHGQMLLAGQTPVHTRDGRPRYAALAANEAEKAAEINILEVRAFGRMGRVYLGGEERYRRGLTGARGGYRAAHRTREASTEAGRTR